MSNTRIPCSLLSKKSENHSGTAFKNLLLLLFAFIFVLASVLPINAEDDNTENQIKMIRSEFTTIEKSSFGILIFVKDSENVWHLDDGNTESVDGENFQQTRLFIDEKGMIRKLVFFEQEVGLEYTRKEYSFRETGL